MTLADKFDYLAVLKGLEKQSQAAADDHKRRRKEFEAALWEEASEQNTLGIRTDLGRYSLCSTIYGTVTDRELFHGWCRDQGMEDEYLKTEEESRRVNELVRARLETSEDLPPGLSWYDRRYISHTSTKED